MTAAMKRFVQSPRAIQKRFLQSSTVLRSRSGSIDQRQPLSYNSHTEIYDAHIIFPFESQNSEVRSWSEAKATKSEASVKADRGEIQTNNAGFEAVGDKSTRQ